MYSRYERLAGDNGYKCSDGTKGYCSTNQACFSNNNFTKGEWSDGCKTVYTHAAISCTTCQKNDQSARPPTL